MLPPGHVEAQRERGDIVGVAGGAGDGERVGVDVDELVGLITGPGLGADGGVGGGQGAGGYATHAALAVVNEQVGAAAVGTDQGHAGSRGLCRCGLG